MIDKIIGIKILPAEWISFTPFSTTVSTLPSVSIPSQNIAVTSVLQVCRQHKLINLCNSAKYILPACFYMGADKATEVLKQTILK